MIKRRWLVAQQDGEPAPQDSVAASGEQPVESPVLGAPSEVPSGASSESLGRAQDPWSPPKTARPSSVAPKEKARLGPGRWILLILLLLAGAGFGVVYGEPVDAAETARIPAVVQGPCMSHHALCFLAVLPLLRVAWNDLLAG